VDALPHPNLKHRLADRVAAEAGQAATLSPVSGSDSDAKTSASPDHCRMATEHGETHLTLRIDLEADPIMGSLRSSDAASRRFSGWIGLAAALEAIRAELAQEPEPQVKSRDVA
jgi:hypothetical protein